MVAKKKEEIKITEPEEVRVPNVSFYANEFTYRVLGRDIILDFKNITPRFDGNQTTKVTEHNIIIVDLILFKTIINMGFKFVEEFEKRYGEIKNPDYLEKFGQDSVAQLKKMEEKLRKDESAAEYFG